MSSILVPPLPTGGGRPLPTKVVVRLLPPSLTEEDFFDKLPPQFKNCQEEIDYTKYIPGCYNESPSVEVPNVNSRCYINFKSFKAASDFITKFHGTRFEENSTGITYRAVAALAPFQRVPRPWKSMKNLMDNQIYADEHYTKFSQASVTASVPAPQHTFDREKSDQFISPLIKSLSEQSEKINEALKRSRENQKRRTKKGVKQQSPEEVEPPPPLKLLPASAPKKKAKKPPPVKQKVVTIMKRIDTVSGDSWSK